MATRFEEFDLTSRDWSIYIARFRQFLVANNVSPELHVSVLLTSIGNATYSLLRNLLTPAEPQSRTFDEICDLIKEHLEPGTNVVAERFEFKKGTQVLGEDVTAFVGRLRKLARHCAFEDLEDQLRDQLVFGVLSVELQRNLLATRDLDFKTAVEKATAWDRADNITSGVPRRGVNNPVGPGTAAGTRTGLCEKCGRRHAAGEICPYTYYKCNICNEVGHLRKMCPEKINVAPIARRQRRRRLYSADAVTTPGPPPTVIYQYNVGNK